MFGRGSSRENIEGVAEVIEWCGRHVVKSVTLRVKR